MPGFRWIATFCFAAAASAARADEKAGVDARKAVEALERNIIKVVVARDVKALDALLPADYIDLATTGRRTKAAILKELSEPVEAPLIGFEIEDPRVMFPAPGTAVMTYRFIGKAKDGGKVITIRLWTSALYVQRDGKWTPVFSQEAGIDEPPEENKKDK